MLAAYITLLLNFFKKDVKLTSFPHVVCFKKVLFFCIQIYCWIQLDSRPHNPCFSYKDIFIKKKVNKKIDINHIIFLEKIKNKIQLFKNIDKNQKAYCRFKNLIVVLFIILKVLKYIFRAHLGGPLGVMKIKVWQLYESLQCDL